MTDLNYVLFRVNLAQSVSTLPYNMQSKSILKYTRGCCYDLIILTRSSSVCPTPRESGAVPRPAQDFLLWGHYAVRPSQSRVSHHPPRQVVHSLVLLIRYCSHNRNPWSSIILTSCLYTVAIRRRCKLQHRTDTRSGWFLSAIAKYRLRYIPTKSLPRWVAHDDAYTSFYDMPRAVSISMALLPDSTQTLTVREHLRGCRPTSSGAVIIAWLKANPRKVLTRLGCH